MEGATRPAQRGARFSPEEVESRSGRKMQERNAVVGADQAGRFPSPCAASPGASELRDRRQRQGGLAGGAVHLQTRRLYANRTERLQLVWPQGAHRPVLTATFPLQGALQTLPVTGREPDTQRSPHTTPPRELLTPAETRSGSRGPAGGHPWLL